MPAGNAFERIRRAGQVTGQVKRWSATIVANAASTYVLDTVSTAAGVVLVASGLLSGIDFGSAAFALVISYLLWAGGLSKSLSANWQLLETTGTSTNLLSKLAYDVAGLRTPRVGIRRFMSAAGYVVFELAKESPYYLGAFGLAVASDTVSGEEALVFLAGANVGAAAYEYGLGWSTRTLLDGAGHADYASFEKQWVPAEYLAEYYSTVDADEENTIAFFTEAARRTLIGEPALFFGVGPTLHHVFAMAEHASQIHLGDYLQCNLDEVARWIRDEKGAHDWRPFVRYTLQCEGAAAPSLSDVRDREQLTRTKIAALLQVDMRNDRPLASVQQCYATVVSAYCADSATDNTDDWHLYMRRIIELVQPGGTLLLAALGGTRSYLIGGKAFPSPFLEEAHMEAMLRDDFPEAEITIRTVSVPECAQHGYSSIILVAAHCKSVRC